MPWTIQNAHALVVFLKKISVKNSQTRAKKKKKIGLGNKIKYYDLRNKKYIYLK